LDPVLSFYREVRQKYSLEIDNLSNELRPLASPTDDVTISPPAIQLTAAVLIASAVTKVSPFQMTETLQTKPNHLVPSNAARSAPNHSIRVFNNDVGKEDLKTLEGQAWLNDKVNITIMYIYMY